MICRPNEKKGYDKIGEIRPPPNVEVEKPRIPLKESVSVSSCDCRETTKTCMMGNGQMMISSLYDGVQHDTVRLSQLYGDRQTADIDQL